MGLGSDWRLLTVESLPCRARWMRLRLVCSGFLLGWPCQAVPQADPSIWTLDVLVRVTPPILPPKKNSVFTRLKS